MDYAKLTDYDLSENFAAAMEQVISRGFLTDSYIKIASGMTHRVTSQAREALLAELIAEKQAK